MTLQAKANRVRFLAACKRADEATGDNNIKAILSCVLITAGKDTLLVRGTNLDKEVVADCAAVVAEEGEVAIEDEQLCKCLGVLSDDEVALEIEDGGARLRLFTAKDEYFFPILGDEFPAAMEQTDATTYTFTADRLAEAVQWTAFCVEDFLGNKGNWRCRGLLVDSHGGFLWLVGIGKNSMACYRTALATQGKGKFIIPEDVIKPVRTFLKSCGSEDAVDVCLSSSMALFRCGRSYVATRLMEGKPPPWETNFKIPYEKHCTLPAATLISAIIRAQVVLDSKSGMCGVLADKEDGLTIHAKGVKGETTVQVPCEAECKFKFDTSLDVALDMLQATFEKDRQVTIGFSPKYAPLSFAFEGCDHYLFSHARGGEKQE